MRSSIGGGAKPSSYSNALDVFVGLPDNANGRFAELGWAKGFITKGSFKKEMRCSF